jgi:hypothetical protein
MYCDMKAQFKFWAGIRSPGGFGGSFGTRVAVAGAIELGDEEATSNALVFILQAAR